MNTQTSSPNFSLFSGNNVVTPGGTNAVQKSSQTEPPLFYLLVILSSYNTNPDRFSNIGTLIAIYEIKKLCTVPKDREKKMDTAYRLLIFFLFLFLLISNARAGGSLNENFFVEKNLPGGGQINTILEPVQTNTN